MANISYYIIPVFVLVIFIFAIKNKTNCFDCFITGAADGAKTAVKIMPYVLSMFIAVKVFYASGVCEGLIFIKGLPTEYVLQGFFRPISANASMAIMTNIFKTYSADSKIGIASSILQGGTDTTVYVLSLYFGSIGIKKTRYAYPIGLISDLFCFLLSLICFFYII